MHSLSSKTGTISSGNDNKGLPISSTKQNQPSQNTIDEHVSESESKVTHLDNKAISVVPKEDAAENEGQSLTRAQQPLQSKLENDTSNNESINSSKSYHRQDHGRNKRHGDLNPEANLFATNFPPEFGEEQLREMFSPFGKIVRLRFVKASNDQDTYGLIQFENVEECQRALEKYKDYQFNDKYKIKLSIVQRRTSSLSEEPTNLYVRNLPKHWNEEQLRHLFSEFGKILQCRIVSDGIAFVRLDDHLQATTAIDTLNGKIVEDCQLEVKFANRKLAAEHYKAGQTFHKENKNNVYVRYLPLKLTQRELEDMFGQFGKISSAKMNESGIAFVRYVCPDDAQKAIKGLNNKKIDGGEPLVVRLAYYDIGDSRNRLCVQIHNLPAKMLTRDVEKLAVKYGKVAAVKVNEESGEAFVRYANVDDAEEAAKQISGLCLEGCSTALSAKVIYYDTNTFNPQRQSSRGRGMPFSRGSANSSGRYPNQGQHVGVETNPNTSSNVSTTTVNASPNSNSNNPLSSTPLIVPTINTTGNKYFTSTTNVGANYSSPTAYSSPFVMNPSPGATSSLSNPFEWMYPQSMWSTLNVPLLNTPLSMQFMNTTTSMSNSPTVNSNPNPLSNLSASLSLPMLRPVLNSEVKLSTNPPPIRNYSQEQQMLGDQLYQCIKLRHPQYVAKLTGMILTINAGDEDQVRRLLNNPAELDLECEKLVELLKSKQKQSEANQGSSNRNQTTQTTMVNPTLQPTASSNFLSSLITTGNVDPSLLTNPSTVNVMPNFQVPMWSATPATTTPSNNTNYNYVVTDPGNAKNTTSPN